MEIGEKQTYMQQKTTIWNIILDIIIKIFAYIYDFLFNWEDEPYQEEDFLEKEKAKLSAVKQDTPFSGNTSENNFTVSINNPNRNDFETLKSAFGIQTANYIYKLREEVDYLVKEHNLTQENSIMIVIPPEKMKTSLLGPEFFESTFERIYSQYDKDVILKPGKFKIIHNKAGAFYAEIRVDAYTVTQELLVSI